MRKFFVTGIGTDVGKTIASAILVEALKADYWKPIQCGAEPSSDSVRISSLISNITSKIHSETYFLKQPMSPHAAAQLENIQINLSQIVLPLTQNENLIIEGAGGLMVPLNDEVLIADLIAYLQAEVVVVSSFYLGSINHTLLTCSELKRRKIAVAGIIFNGEYNKASADIILKHTGFKLLGSIKQEGNVNKELIKRYAVQFKNV